MKKRFLCVALSAVLLAASIFGGAFSASAGVVRDTVEGALSSTVGDSHEVISTQKYYDFFTSLDALIYRVFRFHIIPQDKVEIVLDEKIIGLADYVNENCGIDAQLITSNIPSYTAKYLDVAQKLNIDVEGLRQQIMNMSDKAFDDGNKELSYALHFVAMVCGSVKSITVSCEPTNNDGVYELAVKIVYNSGESEFMYSGIYYDTLAQKLYGVHGHGVLDIGYDLDIATLMIFTPVNVWMRDYGFCTYYDIVANTSQVFNYDTRRLKFDYSGKEWLVQLWKGRYVISNGAEIGLYYKNESMPIDFYDCVEDSDMLNMSMQLYHGDELLLQRSETTQWWLSGFALSKKVYLPTSLTLNGTITCKDAEMLKAFCGSLDKESDIKYTVDGLTVSFVW